jgi:protein involved in polysaccharide export with SLBB domain
MASFSTYIVLALAALAIGGSGLRAQTGSEPVQAQTRTEIEAMATVAERDAASARTDSLRASKKVAAQTLRSRLRDGDFEVGDRIILRVSGVPALTDTFTVAAGRMLHLPDIGDIPLTGVLRSELQPYLQRQIGRYVINPTVEARSLMRVSVLGAVEKPGYYAVPPDMLVGDALMVAGGLAREADVRKTVVRRGSSEVWTRDRLHSAILGGLTVEQLHLQPGDEIVVGERVRRNWSEIIRTTAYVGAVVAGAWAGTRIW